MKEIKKEVFVCFLVLFIVIAPIITVQADEISDAIKEVRIILQEAPYSGDILVAVNVGESSANTGAMDGLYYSIEPNDENNEGSQAEQEDAEDSLMGYDEFGYGIIDPNSFLEEVEYVEPVQASIQGSIEETTYEVGDVKNFYLYYDKVYYDFELLAIGEHCNVWVIQEQATNSVDKVGAEEIAEEFDRVNSDMTEYFGTPTSTVDIDNDGKTNIICYDIAPSSTSSSYIAGFFYSGDCYYENKLDIIHIDSNQGMNSGVEQCYSTLVHEYQHLIHFGYLKGASSTYINEAFSMAAEHLIYGVEDSRIYTYNTSSAIQYGQVSLNQAWGAEDQLGNYALSYLFGQYIRTQYSGGATIYKEYLTGSGEKDIAGLLDFLNIDSEEELINNFYIALAAQESEGVYGFGGEEWVEDISIRTIAMSDVSIEPGACVYFGEHENLSLENADSSISFTSIGGYETINISVGDVNEDGTIDNSDVTLLFQYVSKWDVELNEALANVNGDNVIDNSDVTLLFQYVSKWDVELY